MSVLDISWDLLFLGENVVLLGRYLPQSSSGLSDKIIILSDKIIFYFMRVCIMRNFWFLLLVKFTL